MELTDCECGESYWMNTKGWTATCDKCGRELKPVNLKADNEPVANVLCSVGFYFAQFKERHETI